MSKLSYGTEDLAFQGHQSAVHCKNTHSRRSTSGADLDFDTCGRHPGLRPLRLCCLTPNDLRDLDPPCFSERLARWAERHVLREIPVFQGFALRRTNGWAFGPTTIANFPSAAKTTTRGNAQIKIATRKPYVERNSFRCALIRKSNGMNSVLRRPRLMQLLLRSRRDLVGLETKLSLQLLERG